MNLIDWAGVHASVDTPRGRGQVPGRRGRQLEETPGRARGTRVTEVAQRSLTGSSDQKRRLGEAVRTIDALLEVVKRRSTRMPSID